MKKEGRHIDTALLRTTVNQKLQTSSQRRLIKDLEEIQKEKIPTVGVTARPLETNLFIWHANIRGPQHTLYQSGVFHLELIFPQSYPNHPPSIRIYTRIPHPNVFGDFICLDMLQPTEGVRAEGSGWSSAYSVQSVLTQLQSFLFEQNLTGDKAQIQREIKKAVKDANSFKCPTCKHGGKLSLWPPFSQKQQVISEFQILEEENDLIRKQLICFHTKLTFLQNQLGLGLNISKIPRTGLIKQGETFFDYISIKAFLKESMNLTSNNEKISHWLPVYFGTEDNEERFFHFLKKSLSMIMTNSTKNFRPDFILQVFPKLFITLAFHIMDEKKHPSIRIIRILTHIHSMFLYSLKKFPELQQKITQTIKKFINDQESRTKNNFPNLGCILALISASDSYKFKEIVEHYFYEQLDRQVFWILKSVPQLLSDSLEEQADKLRTQIVFKSQMTSFHIFCFNKLFITQICERRANKPQFLNEYESNLCKLTNKQENYFQQEIFNIAKKITNFSQFFKYMGLKERNQEQVLKMLKNAIKNSERKEYHNKFEVMKWQQALSCEKKKSSVNKIDLAPKLPSSEEQFRKLSEKIPNYGRFIHVTTIKQGQKGEFKFDYNEQISQQSDWRQMCIARWSWIKQAMLADPTLSSQDISLKALEHTKKGVSKTQDRVTKIINDRYKYSHMHEDEPKINIPQIDWKRLFLRLDLQDFLKYIDMNPDFGIFYQKLYVCAKNNINTILIPIVEVNNIKSGFYYLTALLTKLITLKYIEFSGLPQINNEMTEKAAKAIKKGLVNFHQAKGQFESISFSNINTRQSGHDLSEYLFNYLSQTESLTSLRFNRADILIHGNAMKSLSNILVNLKDVQQIQLIKCYLDQEKCKILADALMRMKKLRIVRIHSQTTLGLGLASIIYNLAFSPNLTMLDLSDINIGGQNELNQTVVSLCKLLKISSSIQVLKLNHINSLNNCFTQDFWSAVGDCKSLRVLNISRSGDLSAKIQDLGRAIAFNAKRKGSLAYLNLTATISNSATINAFYEGMNISEYDQQSWYGDPNKLAKMIAVNYPKSYYNNLKALQLDTCSNLNPSFALSNYEKLVNKTEPEYVKILADSQNLSSLHVKSTGLQKNIADILVLALDERRVGLKCQLKILDLSRNNLQKDGVKMLAGVLPYNNVIEFLDLSKTNMGVSGADQIAKALKNNKSLKYLNFFNNKIGYDGAKSIAENVIAHHPNLQFLELGHNRIRDKGLASIVTALLQNSKSNIKVLGLRFNFLTSEAILQNFSSILNSKTSLEEVFIRNNLINDEGLYKLQQLHKQSKSKLSIDILERVKYLDQDRLDRTIWVHPIDKIKIGRLKSFFEITHQCGIVVDFRVRNGRKYQNKKGENKFCFIQFADPASVIEALSLASKQLTVIEGTKFRVFKAGTGTFLFSKKTAKQKNLQTAKMSLPRLPFPGAVAPKPAVGVPDMRRQQQKRIRVR